MNKKNNKKIIHLCFILYLCIFFIITLITSAKDVGQEGLLQKNDYKTLISVVIYAIIATVMKNIIIFVIYLAIILANITHRKEKLNKLDFRYSQYYRDILQDYAPSTLSFIDNLKTNNIRESVADLLSLKIKGKIVFEEKIKIIDDSRENLTESQKYILDNIQDGKLTIKNHEVFVQSVIRDSLDAKIIEKEPIELFRNMKKVLKNILILFSIPWIATGLIYILFLPENIERYIILLFIITILGVPLLFFVYLLMYNNKKVINPYFRTKLGQEINEKLEGLKNYVREYGLLDKLESDSIILWEDYLIYSLIFGQNKQIIDDMQKYIIIEEGEYNTYEEIL